MGGGRREREENWELIGQSMHLSSGLVVKLAIAKLRTFSINLTMSLFGSPFPSQPQLLEMKGGQIV